MREYLTCILCAAFLCSIVNAIDGDSGGIRRLICGLFLALTVLYPLGSLELPALSIAPYHREAAHITDKGTQQAEDARKEIILGALEAYILTKAAEQDLEVAVALTLNPDGTPASVRLSGPASPAERAALGDALIRDLGLGKEALSWTNEHQSSE